ncbi:hypothetical protein LCGC14_0522930 [marine sediment metagenome]|uniref:Uncharacterized protein n=1 Tax=marine sediment metagenome TaxID=412755 RepID=A0A0F9UJH7_9ZZZZ
MTRPDDVYRTGVIQPYNIMTRTAGQQAQDSISRFIQVARPHGAYVGLDGAGFGLVTPEVIRTLGAENDEDKTNRYYWAAGGVLLGLLGGVLIGRAL